HDCCDLFLNHRCQFLPENPRTTTNNVVWSDRSRQSSDFINPCNCRLGRKVVSYSALRQMNRAPYRLSRPGSPPAPAIERSGLHASMVDITCEGVFSFTICSTALSSFEDPSTLP